MVGEGIRSPTRVLLSAVLCLHYCALPFPARGSVKRLYKETHYFFNLAMAAAIDDLAFELCWSFDRPARRRQAVRTWHKRGHKTRLSKCTCACCGELFYRGFVRFLVFAGCAPVCCAQQLCPFSECPFECAHYFFGVPTIFACPLIRPLFSGACPLFSGAHYFFGSALISAQKMRVEPFSVKQKQPIRSIHLLK